MSLLNSLTTADDIADEKDSLGGGFVLESGLYTSKVTLAYLSKSTGGALALNLTLKTEDGSEVRQQLWMTAGTAKGGNNFYIDKKGDKQYLPGFLHANALCLLTIGKEISQLETETKVVNVYNSEAKAEVPTNVEMLVDLLGQDIVVGLIKQTVDKNIKDGAGNYVPTGETRDENEIDKLFRARDLKTTAEIKAQAPEAVFATTWKEKWTGVTKDRSTKTAGKPGAPKPAGTGNKPQNSLFT